MKTGKVIQEIRRKKNLSQGELAKQIEVSQAYLSQVERDKKKPSMDLLEKISEQLEIPVYYLLFRGLEVEKDISEEKREAYKKLSPAISSMIEGFFLS